MQGALDRDIVLVGAPAESSIFSSSRTKSFAPITMISSGALITGRAQAAAIISKCSP